MPPPFDSLLVANRGEIAVRILRAAREMDIRAIAVYSEADAGALWTRIADEAHCLGPAPASESYLNIERILAVAKASGAQAVHPGYGLLSENAEFASAVIEAGIAFVGPDPRTIAVMGDKVTARAEAKRCGVPVLPGTDAPVATQDEAAALAEVIGWPIAVKASFGGGGRGMRIANGPDDLAAALEQAGREAASAFGRGEVFLERYLVRPRHIEVQVLGDAHGTIIHLGDRDCSVQRRHQKLLEEAPAPALPDALRERIADAALTLCKSVSYKGAGTVEFLADVSNDAFYFLEMNTRLQVEHGVSELVTGIDLVRHQIRVASGQPLGLTQQDVIIRGHAIQVRIAAEDPWSGFRPVPGQIDDLRLPLGPWVRLDFGVEQGDAVPPFYDSMFGKIQVLGADRDEARNRLNQALGSFRVHGVPTTAPYLRTLLDQPDFVAVKHDTGSLERDWAPDPALAPPSAVAAECIAPPLLAGSPMTERRIAVPWGGRMIDVAVFGVSSIRRTREGDLIRGRGVRGERMAASAGSTASPMITSPMDAVIMSVAVAVGDTVTKGAPLFVLEAMKMEVVVPAPYDGVVNAVHGIAGELAKAGSLLAVMDQNGDEKHGIFPVP